MSVLPEISPKPQRFPCPCCGYLTIDDPRRFDICPVCFWEDDAIQFDDEDYDGGANDMSLRQARENYRKFGAKAANYDNLVRPPLPDEIPVDRE